MALEVVRLAAEPLGEALGLGQDLRSNPMFAAVIQKVNVPRIEDVIILLDDRTLAVLNDNNFPFSAGRTPGQPDNNEFITIRLPHRL